MDNREDILKKIEKLLALAGNNPNENEAVAAALKAQELMAKHNIELADVQGNGAGQKITRETYEQGNSSHNVSKWKYRLSNIIARNFRCRSYTIQRRGIVFYGYEKDAKIALEVFRFLFETGNRLAERYYRKCRRDGRETKGLLNTYLTGFCDGIREVLDRQSTALMLVVPKEVDASYKEYTKGFINISGKLAKSGDIRAYRTGKQEGRETVTARSIEG